MADFAPVLAFTLAAEGGFVDDPLDPGGATKFGITLQGLSDWRGHPCTPGDVRAMHVTEANAIYETNYWDVVAGAKLPPGLDLLVFDFGVNAGPQRSIFLLQGLVGTKSDGIIGPRTIACCNGDAAIIRTRLTVLANIHERYYHALPAYAHDGHGWTSRVNASLATALALASYATGKNATPGVPKPRLRVPAVDEDTAPSAV